MTRKQYRGEFKEKVCEDYLSTDMTYEEISGKYEIGASTLSKWIGIYREYGAAGFEKQVRKGKNTGKKDFKDGICFVYTHQCPFMEEYMMLLSKICEEETIAVKSIQLKSADEVKELGGPFGTYSMYDDGDFVTHELFSENKFRKYLTARE